MPSFLQAFEHLPLLIFLLSIFVNILVSVAGVLPSLFITAANLAYFGFVEGLVVSIIGEALGAIVSFYLYRKGIKKFSQLKNRRVRNKWIQALRDTSNFQGFLLVIALRIFPFIPSGVVTFTAAMSKMTLIIFAFASTLGKIPALYIEALSVYTVFQWKTEYQWIVITLSFLLLFFYFITFKKKKSG